MNRRDMLKTAGAAIAGTSLLGMETFASNPGAGIASSKKALIIGAHPDDPETGCGGTMIRLKQAGYEVVAVYMTKGEAGISGKTHEESAAIRVKEATKASEILGVRPVFMTQIDGNTETVELLDLETSTPEQKVYATRYGTFTIEYVLPNGTPWTPSTP